MYTLNFNYEQQTVMAKLKANSSAVLVNETVALNASDTYITGFSTGNQGTLQYQWICEAKFEQVCNNQNGPILNIKYSDF